MLSTSWARVVSVPRFQDRDYELQTVDDCIKLRSMMTNEVAQRLRSSAASSFATGNLHS